MRSAKLPFWTTCALLSLWLFQTRPQIWLDASVLRHAADWYTLPVGPWRWLAPLSEARLRFFASYVPWLHAAGLVAFALPWRRARLAGGLLAGLAALFIDGINYGCGKVDHQAIAHALPLLLALGEWAGSPRAFVRSGLAFFYLQSCLGKALSGWLSPHAFAFRDWLVLYRDFYTMAKPSGLTLLAKGELLLWPWKILDYMVVLFEGALALAWWRARVNRYLALEILLVFHFSIYFVFGIDFTRLLLPVYWVALGDGSLRWLGWGIGALAAQAFMTVEWQFVAISVLTLAGFCLDRKPPPLATSRPNRWALAAWLALQAITLPLALSGHEPFPSFGGPIFPGSTRREACTGSCQLSITRDGQATSLKALGLDARLWTPKLVESFELAPQFPCLNHDFIPLASDRAGLQRAIESVRAAVGFQVDWRWVPYGSCAGSGKR